MIFEGFRPGNLSGRALEVADAMHDLWSWSPCAMADRNAWPVLTVDGVIRNNPRSSVFRQPRSRLRSGTPAPIRPPATEPRRRSTRWLQPPPCWLLRWFKASRYNPFVSHAFFSALEASGFGLRADRLGAAPSARPARRRDRRHRALLSEIPLARRIRLRPRLGRCL